MNIESAEVPSDFKKAKVREGHAERDDAQPVVVPICVLLPVLIS